MIWAQGENTWFLGLHEVATGYAAVNCVQMREVFLECLGENEKPMTVVQG